MRCKRFFRAGLGELLCRSGHAQGCMIEVSFIREDHIAKKILRTQVFEIARTKSFRQFAVIGTADKGAASDNCQLTFVFDLNRHSEALQPRMTAIMSDTLGPRRPFMGNATERIAKFD